MTKVTFDGTVKGAIQVLYAISNWFEVGESLAQLQGHPPDQNYDYSLELKDGFELYAGETLYISKTGVMAIRINCNEIPTN